MPHPPALPRLRPEPATASGRSPGGMHATTQAIAPALGASLVRAAGSTQHSCMTGTDRGRGVATAMDTGGGMLAAIPKRRRRP